MTRVIYDDRSRCLALVERLAGRIVGAGEEYQGIGLERDGRLIATIVYTLKSEHNMVLNVAVEPGCKWCSHEFMRVVFGYPFVQLGLSRVSVFVPSTNHASLKLNLHLGFVEEGRMRGAADDGGDLLVLGMLRNECRWIGEASGQERQKQQPAAAA